MLIKLIFVVKFELYEDKSGAPLRVWTLQRLTHVTYLRPCT
jgi:hypothetical protein